MNERDRIEKAYLAGGCFWGVEYHLRRIPGVMDVVSGFMGGHVEHPTYKMVYAGNTGHIETVEVTFDPGAVTFETIARRFFEIHDPTQENRQGPDIGEQYKSVVFYASETQRHTAGILIRELIENGYDVVTELRPAGDFWPADEYHQQYYDRAGRPPVCHFPVKRFAKNPIGR